MAEISKSPEFRKTNKERYGTGQQETYLPWLRVQNFSSHGEFNVTQGIKAQRVPSFINKAYYKYDDPHYVQTIF